MDIIQIPQRDPSAKARDPVLWSRAQALESTFLAEMLRHGGLGRPQDSFGGGVGEAQFAGLLVSEQANALVKAGGIGLAEAIYRALTGPRP